MTQAAACAPPHRRHPTDTSRSGVIRVHALQSAACAIILNSLYFVGNMQTICLDVEKREKRSFTHNLSIIKQDSAEIFLKL